MNCGCMIETDYDSGPSCFKEQDRKARKPHKCHECRRVIQVGEVYRYESGVWDGRPEQFHICLDCLSLRKAFFCGFTYGTIWGDFHSQLNDVDGDVSWSALAALTPKAREEAIRLIEEVWDNIEDEEDAA